MQISILCSDGSPLGVSLPDLWGKGKRGVGIGGSEYALLTMCEQWHNEGHEVILYNDPKITETLFIQKPVSSFDPSDKPDVLIVFRSPNPKAVISKAKLKVWFSCDQFTLPHLSFSEFSGQVDKVVVISEYHSEYFKTVYGIDNTTVIDLPVRYQDFGMVSEVEKIPHRMIFTSVPDRGLHFLWTMWPIIKRDIPDASLVITSDYRLWGCADPTNQQHRLKWMRYNGVEFVGAVPRDELLKIQAEAELFLYPSYYDTAELFCISAAEAQAMGVYPITSGWGALETTNMGSVIPGIAPTQQFQDAFIAEVKRLCAEPSELAKEAHKISQKAYHRFLPKTVSQQWMEKIFTT